MIPEESTYTVQNEIKERMLVYNPNSPDNFTSDVYLAMCIFS